MSKHDFRPRNIVYNQAAAEQNARAARATDREREMIGVTQRQINKQQVKKRKEEAAKFVGKKVSVNTGTSTRIGTALRVDPVSGSLWVRVGGKEASYNPAVVSLVD